MAFLHTSRSMIAQGVRCSPCSAVQIWNRISRSPVRRLIPLQIYCVCMLDGDWIDRDFIAPFPSFLQKQLVSSFSKIAVRLPITLISCRGTVRGPSVLLSPRPLSRCRGRTYKYSFGTSQWDSGYYTRVKRLFGCKWN